MARRGRRRPSQSHPHQQMEGHPSTLIAPNAPSTPRHIKSEAISDRDSTPPPQPTNSQKKPVWDELVKPSQLGRTPYFGPRAKSVEPIVLAVGEPFYFPVGYVSIIAGQGGVGKSSIAALLSVALATGQPFLGAQTKQGNVLYLDFEAGEDGTIPVIKDVACGLALPFDELDGKLFYQSFVEDGRRLRSIFKDVLQAVKDLNIRVVIVDAYQAAFNGDAKGAEVVTEHMTLLKRIAAQGVAVIVLDHVAKPQQDVSSKTPYGSVYKTNYARSVHVISQPDDSRPDELTWEVTKLNVGRKPKPFKVQRKQTADAIQFWRDGDVTFSFQTKVDEIRSAVDGLFLARPGAELKRQDVLNHVSLLVPSSTSSYIEKAVDTLLAEQCSKGHIEKLTLPGRGQPTAYRSTPPLGSISKQ